MSQDPKALIARAALEELERRRRAQDSAADKFKPTEAELRLADQLEALYFPQQAKFYTSTARRRVGFCTRRAGKTEGTAICLLVNMLRYPNDQFIYFAKTIGVINDTLWKKLKEYIHRFNLPIETNENRLDLTHTRGGGQLICSGADNAAQVDKRRGLKLRGAVLDESGHFGEHMENLVVEVITPALRDQKGWLIMIGTAGRKREGLFYKAITGQLKKGDGTPQYELHQWSIEDNTYLDPEDRDIHQICNDEFGGVWDDPRFMREFRMIWATSDLERVFSGYQSERNDMVVSYNTLPKGHDWKVMLGVDFGWSDKSAIAAVAFSKTHQSTYILETWAKSRAYADEIVRELMALKVKYPVQRIVGDTGGTGKFIVESIRRDYKLNIDPAVKTEKVDHVGFMNSAFLRKDLMVNKGDPVCEEFLGVAWHENGKKFGDHEVDDRANACLYAWRAAKFLSAKKTQEREDRLTKVDQGLKEMLEVLHRVPEKAKPYWETFRERKNHLDAISNGLAGKRRR